MPASDWMASIAGDLSLKMLPYPSTNDVGSHTLLGHAARPG